MKSLYENEQRYKKGTLLPASQYGTWNLYWCYYMDGLDPANPTGTKYDETNPHWCSCNNFGKWKDSTLSTPMYHAVEHFVDWHKDAALCQCHGTRVCSPGNCRCESPNFGEIESITCHL